MWQGEDLAGRPFDAKDAAVKRVIPLMWQDAVEAVAEHGTAGLAFLPPAALGAGVTTYQDRPKASGNAASGPKPAPTPIPYSEGLPGVREPLTINPELIYGNGNGARMKGIDPREGAILRGMTPNSETLLKPPPRNPMPLLNDKDAKQRRAALRKLKQPPAVEKHVITYPSRPK
jgi:hypothetical protein